LIKIPICWIISNFYSNKLEHYLICGTVVHFKKGVAFYVEKNQVSKDKYKQSIYHWNRYTL